MVDQQLLDTVTASAATALFALFQNRLSTPASREDFERKLIHAVRSEIVEPFEISVTDYGNGAWNVVARAIPTAAEIAADEAKLRAFEEDTRARRIGEDRQRALEHPSRASVTLGGSDQEPHVSIAGMIEDLRYWQAPPDLRNEETAGFWLALDHVERYLRARAKLGSRDA